MPWIIEHSVRVDHYHHYPASHEVMDGMERLRGLITRILERLNMDLNKLLLAVARLEASDTRAIAALTALRDQNKAAQTQIEDLSKQLADLKAGADTTEIQAALDEVAARLGKTADAVEAGVENNPSVPNMPPAETPPAETTA